MPLGPMIRPTSMKPVMLGSQGQRCARKPPIAPANSSMPNTASVLGSGGHAGRKSIKGGSNYAARVSAAAARALVPDRI